MQKRLHNVHSEVVHQSKIGYKNYSVRNLRRLCPSPQETEEVINMAISLEYF